MKLTDILYDYLSVQLWGELKNDANYQAAQAAEAQAGEALSATLSPQQSQLLETYLEERTHRDNLELINFLSHCSLLVLKQEK